MDELIVVFTTVPSRATAMEIAQVLVEQKFGACVQILSNITSTYIWEGKFCIESEASLAIKTTADRYSALELKLREIHPYSEPEIFAVAAVACSHSYLDWVAKSVR